jgi:hypothetical protein
MVVEPLRMYVIHGMGINFVINVTLVILVQMINILSVYNE